MLQLPARSPIAQFSTLSQQNTRGQNFKPRPLPKFNRIGSCCSCCNLLHRSLLSLRSQVWLMQEGFVQQGRTQVTSCVLSLLLLCATASCSIQSARSAAGSTRCCTALHSTSAVATCNRTPSSREERPQAGRVCKFVQQVLKGQQLWCVACDCGAFCGVLVSHSYMHSSCLMPLCLKVRSGLLLLMCIYLGRFMWIV
jgi:hypothetical protein